MDEKPNSCQRIRCGANADCIENNGLFSCACQPNYFGNPYLSCQPECVINSDCTHNLACINNKCVEPCIGACGVNAHCQTVNHVPVCFCPQGFSGDPFITCYPIKSGM